MNRAQKIANWITRAIVQAFEEGYTVDIVITNNGLVDVRVGLDRDQGANVTLFNPADKTHQRNFAEEIRIKTPVILKESRSQTSP